MAAFDFTRRISYNLVRPNNIFQTLRNSLDAANYIKSMINQWMKIILLFLTQITI